MRGKRVLIAAAVLLGGIAVGAVVLRHRRQAATTPWPAAAALIAPKSEVTLSGSIRPQHVTGVTAPEGVDGNIEAFLADVGQDVYEGQVLARVGAAGLEHARDAAATALDRAQEQASRMEAAVNSAILEASRADANLQRSRMALDRVGKSFSRQKTLLAAGATPRQTYQRTEQEYAEAEAEFEVMEKAARSAREATQSLMQQLAGARKAVSEKTRELDQAQVAMAGSEVHAPVDGTVVARHGEAGKPVTEAGKDLFQIATDLYSLEVPLEAPLDAAKRLRPGQQALILILDLQSAGIMGEVRSVDGSQVVVEFSNSSPAIRPGMRADVRLKLD